MSTFHGIFFLWKRLGNCHRCGNCLIRCGESFTFKLMDTNDFWIGRCRIRLPHIMLVTVLHGCKGMHICITVFTCIYEHVHIWSTALYCTYPLPTTSYCLFQNCNKILIVYCIFGSVIIFNNISQIILRVVYPYYLSKRFITSNNLCSSSVAHGVGTRLLLPFGSLPRPVHLRIPLPNQSQRMTR